MIKSLDGDVSCGSWDVPSGRSHTPRRRQYSWGGSRGRWQQGSIMISSRGPSSKVSRSMGRLPDGEVGGAEEGAFDGTHSGRNGSPLR